MAKGLGFKVLMAVSGDGFVARGPEDRMEWTGQTDKGIFRLLTLTGGSHKVLAGRRTADLLPKLADREVVAISRTYHKGITLQEAAWAHRDAWLIGGLDVVLAALDANLVEQVVLCQTTARLGGGISVEPLLNKLDRDCHHRIKLGEVYVNLYSGVNHGA
jgi:dihydrofolate reductase